MCYRSLAALSGLISLMALSDVAPGVYDIKGDSARRDYLAGRHAPRAQLSSLDTKIKLETVLVNVEASMMSGSLTVLVYALSRARKEKMAIAVPSLAG